MASLSALDWVCIAVVVFSVVQALSAGFFREFFSMAGAIAGFLLAAWEYHVVAAWYSHLMHSPWPAEIVAFFSIFVVVALLGSALGSFAAWALKKVGLRWFDRILGAGFGIVRGVLVSVVIVSGLAAFAPQYGLQNSRFAPVLLAAGRGVIWAAPADFRQRFWDGWNLLRTIPQHVPDTKNGAGDRRNSTPY